MSALGQQLYWEVFPADTETPFGPSAFGQARVDTITVTIPDDGRGASLPRIHPGPLNASTNFRELTVVVEFAVESVDVPFVELRLQARGGSGPCPDLRVAVNGADGLVLARQRREDRAHDPMPPSPTAGLIDRSVLIPGRLFRRGVNRLSLTTVSLDSAPPREELVATSRPELGTWFGSTLMWDRISLAPGRRLPQPEIVAAATPLFKRDARGELTGAYDFALLDVGDLSGTVLTIAAGEGAEEWAPSMAFGDIYRRLWVADAPGELTLEVFASGDFGRLARQLLVPRGRKWTVHVIPHVHLDVGFTDAPSRVFELHSRNIDKALDLIDDAPDYRFTIDGTISIDEYRRTRAPARVLALESRLREGSVGVGAFYAQLLTGAAGLEALYRAMYDSAPWHRDADPVRGFANVTDVPSYSFAIPSVLAAEGIDAFMAMSDHIRGGTRDSDALHLLSPVRWRGADRTTTLSFFSDCYTQLRFVCGDPPTQAGVAKGLTDLLRRYERDDYLPDTFPLVGTNADNEDLAGGYAGLVARWNAEYEWPRLRFSSVNEYFDSVRPLRDRLPLWDGDGGSFWEDGMGTHALATTLHRRSHSTLVSAEGITALTALDDPGLQPDRRRLDDAWHSVILGAEHTWAADISTTNPSSRKGRRILDWTVQTISRGDLLARDELDRGMSQLGDQVVTPSLPAIVVANTVSWARDLAIDVEIPALTHLCDAEGTPLPQHARAAPSNGLVDVRATVPTVDGYGYQVLRVLPSHGVDEHVKVASVEETLETPFYRVRIDPASGSITSMWHKGLNVELLVQAPDRQWSLAEIVHVEGGGGPEDRGLNVEATSLNDYDPRLPPPELDSRSAVVTIEGLYRTPTGWRLESRGTGRTIDDIRVAIDLLDLTDRVDVDVSFRKLANLAKESVYVAFPFDRTGGRIRYDRQQGWVDPRADHYVGAANEWFCAQGAVSIESDTHSVAWATADAPLFALNDYVRGRWPVTAPARGGSVLSWVMNNYWTTNTPASQEGEIELRYSFAPTRTPDLAAAWKLANGRRTEPALGWIRPIDRGDDGTPRRKPEGRLIDIELSEGVVATVFAGRKSHQLVVRLLETSGEPGSARIEVPARLRGAPHDLISPTERVLRALEPVDGRALLIPLRPHASVSVGLGRNGDAE